MLTIILYIASGALLAYLTSWICSKLKIKFVTKNDLSQNAVRAFGEYKNLPISPLGSFNSNPTSKLESAIHEYQDEHKCRLILINQKDKSNIYGISFLRSNPTIDLPEVLTLISILGEIPIDIPIHIVLRSCGGTLQAAEVITHALKNHKGEVHVFVSHYAQSAATMIALSGTHLHMNANAFLTQTDPQIMGWGSYNIIKVINEIDPNTSPLGIIAKILSYSANGAIQRSNKILSTLEIPSELITLLNGENGHDTPIFPSQLQGYLKNLEIGIPPDLQNIVKLDDQ